MTVDNNLCSLSRQNLVYFIVKPKSMAQPLLQYLSEDFEEQDTDEELFGGQSGAKVVRPGWLEKQGARNTAWRNRYFVLDVDQERLYYYKTEEYYKSKKPQGYIGLT